MANKPFAGPVGRFVQGDAFEAQTKDQQGNQLTVKTGANAGQPTKRWFMAVAYPKNDPQTLPYLQKIAEFARTGWPAFFTSYNPGLPPLFGCSHPRFSIKITDGDGVDDNGKQNATKEGFAGHWIVKYSSSIQAPKVHHAGRYDPAEQVFDPRELPRGFYVRVFGSFDPNDNDQRPGMYANLSMVEIVRPGDIIQSGPSASEAFGGQTVETTYREVPPPPPPGAGGLVATNKDGYTIEQLRAASWTDQQIIDGGYATKAVAPPPPPAPAAQVPPPPPPPAPPKPPAPPAPPHSAYMEVDPNGPPAGFKMLPAAGVNTYKSFIDAGWTHDALVQNGMVGPL